MIKNKKILKNKVLTIKIGATILLLVLIGLLILIFVINGDDQKKSVQDLPNPTDTTDTTNLAPPTDEEKQQAVTNKSKIDEDEARRQSQSSLNNGTKKAVKPIITYSDQYGEKIEIGSYVPGIFEDGGICTANLTKEDRIFSKHVNAVKEGKSTFCPTFNISNAELPEKGIWALVVSYESAISIGSSDSTKIEVK